MHASRTWTLLFCFESLFLCDLQSSIVAVWVLRGLKPLPTMMWWKIQMKATIFRLLKHSQCRLGSSLWFNRPSDTCYWPEVSKSGTDWRSEPPAPPPSDLCVNNLAVCWLTLEMVGRLAPYSLPLLIIYKWQQYGPVVLMRWHPSALLSPSHGQRQQRWATARVLKACHRPTRAADSAGSEALLIDSMWLWNGFSFFSLPSQCLIINSAG